MSIDDDVKAGITEVLEPVWSITDGTKVPESDDIVLRNGAVKLEATYLYADMADSTGLAQSYNERTSAKVIRCYLNAAAKIIKNKGGEIRSFDGDRVMGIFIGESKNTNAVKCALGISWAVFKVIRPKLASKWTNFTWEMDHGVGIDTGEAMLVRGGVWGTNDLISIGRSPNIAAKLSEVRGKKTINVSEAVYLSMNKSVKYHGDKNMWSDMGTTEFGGNAVRYYGSSYSWSPASS